MTYPLITAALLAGCLLGIVIGGHVALRRTPKPAQPLPPGKSAVEQAIEVVQAMEEKEQAS